MKNLQHMKFLLGCVFISLVHVACAPGPRADQPEQSPIKRSASAADGAQLFAEGVISSELPEFATTFSQDGKTVFFNRMPADRSEIRIWSSTFDEGLWSDPAPLPFSDGKYRDVDPFLSPDDRRLYFSSTRPLEGEEAKEYDLWYVEKIGDGWGEPINLGAPINTTDKEIYATLSKNGNLYFTVFEADGDGAGVFRSVWQGGTFLAPQRLEIGDGALRVTNPTIAPDESFLLLVSDHEGQADIYMSRRRADGGWAELAALGPEVNSEFTEFAPSISPDGTTLFFTSERPGVVPENDSEGRRPGDLYVVSMEAVSP